MLLLHVPQVVWHEILGSWLYLCDIVRIDCACSLTSATNPLLPVYAGRAFRLQRNLSDNNCTLNLLYLWLQKRKVYFDKIVCFENVELQISRVWEDLIDWSGKRLRSLTIIGVGCDGELWLSLFDLASMHCVALEQFNLHTSESNHRGRSLQHLLYNNAATLKSLSINCLHMDDNSSSVPLDDCIFPNLRSIQWRTTGHSLEFGAFLSRCPGLTALYLQGGDLFDNSLFLALFDSCPLLKRLKLHGVEGLQSADLRCIASGCPLLEYLEVNSCSDAVSGIDFPEAVRALPLLHTLVSNEDVSEGALLEIVAGGLPSLRVLSTATEFTPSGLYQITAACPHLAGLRISNFNLGVEDPADNINVSNREMILEHCKELKHLVLFMGSNEVSAVNVLLLSIAKCCPNLHTLVLDMVPNFDKQLLYPVMENCTQLRKLVVFVKDLELPANNPTLEITNQYAPPLAEWTPE